MDNKRQPNPRFQEFTQQFDKDQKATGFKISGCDFLFKYDKHGGWYDEKDNYYNCDGILQTDSEGSDYDDDSYSYHSDDIVDEFQDMLRDEEQGIPRPSQKKEDVKVETPVEDKKQVPVEQPKQEKQFDFKAVLQKYTNKQHLRQNLPGELFIYFKQKSRFFQAVKPGVQSKQSVEDKNKEIEKIKNTIKEKRQQVLKGDEWLSKAGVFLDYSGQFKEQVTQKQSSTKKFYDRYWHGSIRTTADKYLWFIDQIQESKHFNLLIYKTFYALKSKFYMKKAEEKVKLHIKEMTDQINKMENDQVILMKFDNLPENYPISFIYDLIDYAGGKWEDIEKTHAISNYSAELEVLKNTALKLVNLEAYTHDRGQFVELDIGKVSLRVSDATKRYYWIQVEGGYKYHECQLCDTIGLSYSRLQLAKHLTLDKYDKYKIRFAIGSAEALRKVLMFRGSSLNTIQIKPVQR